MCDINKSVCLFGDTCAGKLGNAVLRDDVFDVRTGDGDRGSGGKEGNDLGDCVIFGCGFYHNDGFAVGSKRCSLAEIADAAHAGELTVFQRFGVDLTE